MFITYILYSNSSGLHYTGHTSDLPRRLEEHNRGKTSFMRKGMPWIVVYQAEFCTGNLSSVL
ncbi:MAG TPA: GIY-YIG nuclease family protein [Bacteroidales bacterium]|nr:GIY-YIG nuclease family protein [Bacteroidales bacterium]